MVMVVMASVRLNLVMDMEDAAMSTEQLKDLLEDMEDITKDLQNLVMDTAQELATTTEAPREFKDMAMEDIIRGLLMLDTLMAMGNLMCTRAVLITMDLMGMRLTMIIRRDPLMPDMVMEVKATNMLTDHILTTRLRSTTQRLTTMDMERGQLNLDMAQLMSMLNRRIMDMATPSLMNMATTSTRDLLLLNLVMEDTAMSTEPLKDSLEAMEDMEVITRGQPNQAMDITQE